jgi:hypothetical protein
LVPFLLELAFPSDNRGAEAPGNFHKIRLEKLKYIFDQEKLQHIKAEQQGIMTLEIGNTHKFDEKSPVNKHTWTVFVRPLWKAEMIRQVQFRFECDPREFKKLTYTCDGPIYQTPKHSGREPIWIVVTVTLQQGLEMRELDSDGKSHPGSFHQQADYRFFLELNGKPKPKKVKFEVRPKEMHEQIAKG